MVATLPPKKRPYHEEGYVPEYPNFRRGTVLLIGGGPSLNDMDWNEIRTWSLNGKNRYTIAVNDACLTIAPKADLAYWVDARWYQWNRLRIAELCRAKTRMTSAHGISVDYGGATYVENRNNQGFSLDPKYVEGRDSGGIAINIAFHCNAAKVYLIGFDMWDTPAGDETGNFHKNHQLKQHGTPRATHFIPAHTKAAEFIANNNLDFEVLNATPDSALKCWKPARWSRIQ